MGARTGALRVGGRLVPWLLAVGAALPAGTAFGQTLMEGFVSTYNSNPDLLAQRARLRVVDETVSQALAGWRPVIRGIAEAGIAEQHSSVRAPQEQNLRPRSYALTITQPLYRGGKTTAQTRGAEADVRAERAVLRDREQTGMLGTAVAHSDFVRDVATVGLRRNNVRVLQQQLADTNARFQVGELTRTDVAQAESRLAQSQANLTAAEAQAAASRATYQRVVGIVPDARMQEAPLLNSVPETEDQSVALSIEMAPRVVAAKYRVSSASYAIDAAFADLLPQVALVGAVSRGYDVTLRRDHSYSYSIRAQVTVPIYQNGSEYSRVRQAKQFHGQRKNELDSARRQSAELAIRAYRQLESARARLVSLAAQVTAAGIALDGVRQEQLVGTRTTLDVLNAEQELLDAQVQLVSARRDVVVSHYGLLAEIGQLSARDLRLPVAYYDEEQYYRNVRDAWIGLGGN
jgi:TolC family type I secretion outer membrane protein